MNKYTLLILPLISLFYMLNNPSLYSLSLYEMLQVLQRLSQLENHDKALHSSTDHSTHRGCVERKGQLPQPDGSTPNAAQESAGLLRSKDALLAHVQLGVHQNPQVLSYRAVSQLDAPKMSSTELLPATSPACPGPCRWLHKRLAWWLTWCINHSSQFFIICTIAEVAALGCQPGNI